MGAGESKSEVAGESQERAEGSIVMRIHGKMYDLSSFAASHPGGYQVLADYAGQDATEAFEDAEHSGDARKRMEKFLVQEVKEERRIRLHSSHKRVLIVYGTQTGNAAKLANKAAAFLQARIDSVQIDVLSMSDVDPEDLSKETVVLVIASTYSGGEPTKNARFFCNWIRESVHDFRVGDKFLIGTYVGVFGLGNSLYDEHYNTVGRRLYDDMEALGAPMIGDLGMGDASQDTFAMFEAWFKSLWRPLRFLLKTGNTMKNSKAKRKSSKDIVDMEDLGSVIHAQVDKEEDDQPKEMVTKEMRENLTKQGYKIIGSHSGVKLCRWTKAMLRGRGGCYKHTFYGITSYQCMETTPSLACANKCVFCWRHHTNPVGKEWKWVTDPPEKIINGAIDNHCKMIKEMRGVPGVKPDRFEEAFDIQHCALSLVGEPIMYPYINEFVQMLHDRSISSFLVTNAQFPDTIRDLVPVTQLYVSIDASTRDSLQKVDRPLFKDFWERFMDSLHHIAAKPYRTVFRLTLVKGYNMEEIREYCKLIAIGKPTLIEVKGVTFCGSSDASDLTMGNVPFHQEVRSFCEALCNEIGGGEYELACEHEHSCCVLIGHKSLCVEGKWHTWIDYPKFHELIASGEPFNTEDYMAPTPEWAVYGNAHAGFDPNETRFRKKRGKKAAAE